MAFAASHASNRATSASVCETAKASASSASSHRATSKMCCFSCVPVLQSKPAAKAISCSALSGSAALAVSGIVCITPRHASMISQTPLLPSLSRASRCERGKHMRMGELVTVHVSHMRTAAAEAIRELVLCGTRICRIPSLPSRMGFEHTNWRERRITFLIRRERLHCRSCDPSQRKWRPRRIRSSASRCPRATTAESCTSPSTGQSTHVNALCLAPHSTRAVQRDYAQRTR